MTSPSEEPVLRLVGHAGTVRCLQLIENRLVSVSTDTTIKVCNNVSISIVVKCLLRLIPSHVI